MIQFTRATPPALPQLLALMQKYYAHDHLPFDRDRAEGAVNLLLADPRLGEVWLLDLPEQAGPIGYLVLAHGFSLECAGTEAFVDELFILAEHRGQGFGTRALQHAVERCQTNGVKLLRLEVTAHSQDAAKLYKKFGFEDWNRTLLAYPLPRCATNAATIVARPRQK